jgi:hypothetical protein
MQLKHAPLEQIIDKGAENLTGFILFIFFAYAITPSKLVLSCLSWWNLLSTHFLMFLYDFASVDSQFAVHLF